MLRRVKLRYLIIPLLVVIKLGYVAWFYSVGIGYNLGDTAQYVDELNKDVFLDRGGLGFAYFVTEIYSNSVSRSVIELAAVATICFFLSKIKTKKELILASTAVFVPTSIAFMTVASKELLVFFILCCFFWKSGWIRAACFLLLVFLKPSFALIAVFPYILRAKERTLLFFALAVAIFLVITFIPASELYLRGFDMYLSHFSSGNLTYPDAGIYPAAIFLRGVGLQSIGASSTHLFMGGSLFVANAVLLISLCLRHGKFRGGLMYAVYLVSVAPYSVYNLGSAARYQASIILAIVLFDLAFSISRSASRRSLNQEGPEILKNTR